MMIAQPGPGFFNCVGQKNQTPKRKKHLMRSGFFFSPGRIDFDDWKASQDILQIPQSGFSGWWKVVKSSLRIGSGKFLDP